MARTRSIKPAFFSNEFLADLPAETRLLFIALWTIADRDGRMEDRPKRIKAEIFPYDNFDVNDMLSQLKIAGFVIRYEVGGQKYIQINNFVKHQNPHPKEQSNDYPDPLGGSENIDAIYLNGNAEKLNDESSLLPITYYPLPITSSLVTDASAKPKRTKKSEPTPQGIYFRNWLEAEKQKDPDVSASSCPDSLYDEAGRIGFEHTAIDQWEKFHDHWIAQSGQKALKADWIATWRNWLRRDFNGKK